MVRTQIQLTEEQYLQLKQLSLRRRRSLATLVREGVEKVLKEAGEPNLDEARRNALSVVGKYHSGKMDVSVHHDKYLSESYKP
jgi:predicted DNA-binding protein